MKILFGLSIVLILVVLILQPDNFVRFFSSDAIVVEPNQVNTPQPESQTNKPKQATEKVFENELAEQMAVLADRYEESIRFPNYSIPINAGQTDLLQPLEVIPVNLNLGEDVDSEAFLAPAKFVFFHGETIEATLTTSGPTQATGVRIELVENNQLLKSFEVKAQGNQFTAQLKEPSKSWPVDVHIRARFDFGEYGDLSILSPIKYSPKNGVIKQVGEAYVDGVNLAVPVTLDINVAGRYRLSANFFDQHQQPLAHLNAKQNLVEGTNTWILNVHSEVLRAANHPGPYVLDTWTLTKLPERPGVFTSYGESEVDTINIPGFPLNQYDSTPWEDPKDKARLEFLKKLQQ